VRDLSDIEALGMINQNLDSALGGVILGRSLYEKTLTVSEAIKKSTELSKIL
jgi:phosphoribosylformimino-5-aminoimidazole carboxamide ribonucleotide (ProFAR) isomerase